MSEAARFDAYRTTRALAVVENGERSNCSSEVLRAFGIEPTRRWSRSMNEIRERLEREGFRIERLWGTADSMTCPTLSEMIRENPEGDFVLLTGANSEPHSMALRDGKLTDTDLTGTGRRRVNVAYRVTR